MDIERSHTEDWNTNNEKQYLIEGAPQAEGVFVQAFPLALAWVEVGKMSMKLEDKLFLDRFKVDEESHIKIVKTELCIKECPKQPCLYLCPANVYRLEGDRISVNHEGCLECGSCRIACPHLNIEWRFPKGGYGISHKFG